ncbi:MAG: GNAT family N-acetyltransferase [Candidatus Azobacteroides sp.]|nr:GNAT family N-acetyltransferase [Candidatus Azobacteroides sp.]
MQVSSDIQLMKIKLSDAPEIFQAIDANRTDLREWLSFIDDTLDREDTEDLINYINDIGEKTFLIRYRQEVAGLIGFKDTDVLNRRTEIGYWLVEKFRKKGIVTQSVKSLLKYAFEELDLNRVQIKAGTENIKSRRVPERLGFSFEGIEREGEYLNGGFIDLAVYSLLKSEYFKAV